jgi:hypothetical protein
VQVVQRVEVAVLDVQGEGRGAVGARDVQVGRVDAGRALTGRRRLAAAVPFRDRKLFDAQVPAEIMSGCW